MKTFNSVSFLSTVFLFFLTAVLRTIVLADVLDEVVGCGGFVQASAQLAKWKSTIGDKVKINFSSVEVQLFTAEGTLKYATECAPTGYYFIPVYDKGSFYLSIGGPRGWSFAPDRVPVVIGDDNQCNDGNDINFQLTGFALTGRVIGGGQGCGVEQGPAGVTVSLSKGDAPISSATSSKGGSYIFTNLAPDTYTLTAMHPSWTLTKAQAMVEVELGNVELTEPMVVAGYDVRGQVLSAGDPMMGVSVYLYSSHVTAMECAVDVTADPGPVAGETPLCVTKSDASGRFAFFTVPCGDYTVVPRYQASFTNFDIHPPSAAVAVRDGSVVIEAPFQVVGFSIGGRVLYGPEQAGVEGAAILVDGHERAVTDAQGRYLLEQVTAGVYTLDSSKEHMFFTTLAEFRIMPNVAHLPDILVSGYHVCGRVAIDHPPAELASRTSSQLVELRGPNNVSDTRKIDPAGKFCFEVSPGTYTVAPLVTVKDRSLGLIFTPVSREVTITTAPLLSADFVQSRHTVTGRVSCIESPCDGSVTVSLTRISPGAAPKLTSRLTRQDADPSGDYFAFTDVLPGSYRVHVQQDSWCWKNKSLPLEVGGEDGQIHLVHTGYALTAVLSHDMNVIFSLQGDDVSEPRSVPLTKGHNLLCLETPGVYKITASSCFRFDKDEYRYDTAAPRVVDLDVARFAVTGTVRVPHRDDPSSLDIVIRVLKSAGAGSRARQTASGDPERIPTKVIGTKGEEDVLEYVYWAWLGDELELTPRTSGDLLFYPPSRTVTVTQSECQSPVAVIQGRPGLFMTGTVRPAIAEVDLTVRTSQGQVVAEVQTAEDGSYWAGPLYDHVSYSVTASKEGYQFEEATGQGEGQARTDFRALKLAQITVLVKDESGSGVAGVLLSLSGEHGYRSNNGSGPLGMLTFANLLPAQYHLRLLLKEYIFTPASQSLAVAEGESRTLEFTGRRTAFSCYGTVQSLNGEAEKMVSVEALGPAGQHEETVTDADGRYRLRGLQPNTTYTVRVKAADAQSRIDRSSPSSIPLTVDKEDARGVDFIVFRKSTKLDVTGIVHTANEWLSNIEVELVTEADASHVIKTVKLGPAAFFEFAGLSKERYVVRLRSLLNSKQFAVEASHAAVPVSGPGGSPDMSSKGVAASAPALEHIELTFSAKPIIVVQEMPAAPLYALVGAVILIAAVFYRDQTVRMVRNLLGSLPLPGRWVDDSRSNGDKGGKGTPTKRYIRKLRG